MSESAGRKPQFNVFQRREEAQGVEVFFQAVRTAMAEAALRPDVDGQNDQFVYLYKSTAGVWQTIEHADGGIGIVC